MKQWLRVAFVGLGAVAMTACASTSQPASKRRIVTVNTPPPVQASTVRYDGPEAHMACDTKAMRRAALDGDLNNDVASVTVEREVRPGVRTLTDLDINCREYFAHKLGGQVATNDVPQSAEGREAEDETRLIKARTPVTEDILMQVPDDVVMARSTVRYYEVRRGDTLYSIGRRHCTNWEAIAHENDLRGTTTINPGDRLALPSGSC